MAQRAERLETDAPARLVLFPGITKNIKNAVVAAIPFQVSVDVFQFFLGMVTLANYRDTTNMAVLPLGFAVFLSALETDNLKLRLIESALGILALALWQWRWDNDIVLVLIVLYMFFNISQVFVMPLLAWVHHVPGADSAKH